MKIEMQGATGAAPGYFSWEIPVGNPALKFIISIFEMS